MTHEYTFEYLPNIQQLIILFPIIKTQNSVDIETKKLFLNRETKTIYSCNFNCDKETENAPSNLLISIPGVLKFNKLVLPIHGILDNYPQVSLINDVIALQFRNVQLKLQPDNPELNLLKLPVAKTLQSECLEIVCSHCGHLLLNLLNRNFIWKDLPNEHWLELLDCWSCHDNEFAPIAERAIRHKTVTDKIKKNQHEHEHEQHHKYDFHKHSYDELNNFNHGLILPPPGKLYLGTSYLLIHKDDFTHETCPECSANISEPLQDDNLKIYRDALIFKHISITNFFARESFMTLFMHQILDKIDNHSTFHFILASSKNNTSRLYIKPINWNLCVFDAKTAIWRFAFKIGYSLLTESSKISTETETIHCTNQQFTQIYTHLETCHVDSLYNATLKLPGSDFLKISYLINI